MPKRNPLNSGKPAAFGLARWYGNPDRIQRGRWKRATTHSASRTQAAGYVFNDVNTAGERCELTEGSKNFLRYSLTRREISGQSIAYGMGPNKLFVDLNAAGFPISFEDARKLYDAYCDEFNLAVGFLRNTGKAASQNGFVVNLNKRRRNWLLPDANNRDVFPLGWKDPKYRGVLSKIQREGGNAVIQSVNADITKYAMTLIRRYIKKNKIRSNLMLQVYDEIVTCTHKDDSPDFVEVKRKLMLDAAYRWITSVPIEVEGEVLPYWTK